MTQFELGLAQTGWLPEDDTLILKKSLAHSIRSFDAVPTKYSPGGFQTAVSAWMRAGIGVTSVQGFFFNKDVTVCSCREHSRKLEAAFSCAVVDAQIAQAEFMILGAPSSRVGACSVQQFCDAVFRLGDIATSKGLVLLLENLPVSCRDLPLASLGDLRRVMKKTSPTNGLGICLDLGNLASCLGGLKDFYDLEDLDSLEHVGHIQANMDYLDCESKEELQEVLTSVPSYILEQANGLVTLEFALGQINWELV
jgi:hypothetical protein